MEISNDYAKDDRIGIDEMSITYSQEPDCCQDIHEYQSITITAVNNGSGKDGWFLRLKTDCWAIDGIPQLSLLIKDFESRLNLVTKE